MRTLVVAYDASESAERALDRAVTLTLALASKLVVLSVAPVVASVGRGGGGIDTLDSPDKHRAELRQARAKLEGLGIDAQYVAAVGDPGDTIVEIADQHDADLIIVGTRAPGFCTEALVETSHGIRTVTS